MDKIVSGTVVTTGTREVAHRLAEFIERAEHGEVFDIIDQRGRERRHRAYLVGVLPDEAEPTQAEVTV